MNKTIIKYSAILATITAVLFKVFCNNMDVNYEKMEVVYIDAMEQKRKIMTAQDSIKLKKANKRDFMVD